MAGGGGGRPVRLSSSVAASETLDIPDPCSVRYHGLSDRIFSGMEDMPARVVLTYRDYEALPADGRRYELHDGELLVTVLGEQGEESQPSDVPGLAPGVRRGDRARGRR